MGRKWKEHFQLPDKRYVGYSLWLRDGIYMVRFETEDGGRKKLSTGETALSRALPEAARIVLRHYGFCGRQGPETWDDVDAKLR